MEEYEEESTKKTVLEFSCLIFPALLYSCLVVYILMKYKTNIEVLKKFSTMHMYFGIITAHCSLIAAHASNKILVVNQPIINKFFQEESRKKAHYLLRLIAYLFASLGFATLFWLFVVLGIKNK